MIGAVFSPTGTKDFATYITKIRQSGADALYMVLAGRRLQRVPVQAKQYRLGDKVQLLTEVVDLNSHPRGRRCGGRAGRLDPLQLHARQSGEQGVRRTRGRRNTARSRTTTRASSGRPARSCRPASTRPAASRPTSCAPALETVAIDSIKGHVAMRACDHQAMQQGFMVKVVKQEDPMPVPRGDRDLSRRSNRAGLQQDDL